jgi:hypothetical protein
LTASDTKQRINESIQSLEDNTQGMLPMKKEPYTQIIQSLKTVDLDQSPALMDGLRQIITLTETTVGCRGIPFWRKMSVIDNEEYHLSEADQQAIRTLLTQDAFRDAVTQLMGLYHWPFWKIAEERDIAMGLVEPELHEEKEPPFIIGRNNTSWIRQAIKPLGDYYDDKSNDPIIRSELITLIHALENTLESGTEKEKTKAKCIIGYTQNLLSGKLSPEDYNKDAYEAQGSPSRLIQILSALMFAVSAAVLAVGLAIGAVPAVIVGSIGVTAGYGFFSKASERTGTSKAMLDLSKAKDDVDNNKDHEDEDENSPAKS